MFLKLFRLFINYKIYRNVLKVYKIFIFLAINCEMINS